MNYLRHNLSRFKLITFDVTDTLLEYAVRPERHYAQVINSVLEPKLGITIDEKVVGSSFGNCFRIMKGQYPNFGYAQKHVHQESWRWWWRTLVERVTLEAASRSNCKQIPAKLLMTISEQLIDDYTFDTKQVCWKKCSGVDQLLGILRYPIPVESSTNNQRIVLGIVSNFDSRLNTILRNNGISSKEDCENGVVDFIITSYDVGVEKPDSRIFQIALERAKQSLSCEIQPDEALHIGNLYKEDYTGARGAGWHALLVNVPESKQKQNEDMRAIVPGWHIFEGIPKIQARLENDPKFEW